MDARFVTNPAQSAADDAEVEAEIECGGGNALRLGLHAYAFDVDNRDALTLPDWEEETRNRRALAYCLPVVICSIAVILLVWGA